MDFQTYQLAVANLAIYPHEVRVLYPAIGLANESGEALGVIKKALRGDYSLDTVLGPTEVHEKLVKEMGDALWYLAQLATDIGESLDAIAVANLAKLDDRRARGVLMGDGGDR